MAGATEATVSGGKIMAYRREICVKRWEDNGIKRREICVKRVTEFVIKSAPFLKRHICFLETGNADHGTNSGVRGKNFPALFRFLVPSVINRRVSGRTARRQ